MYRTFKNHPIEEKYLTVIPNKIKRRSLTKFRLSAHNLNIERLRYTTKSQKRIPPEERLCLLCNLQETEDEQHFLAVCPNYSMLREKLFMTCENEAPKFKDLNVKEKFYWIMTAESLNILDALIKFIEEAFNKREKINN